MDASIPLKITNWYKYLLYISAVLLVGSFFVNTTSVITNAALESFAFQTIILFSILWFFGYIADVAGDMAYRSVKEHGILSDYHLDLNVIDAIWIITQFIFLIIWLGAIAPIILPWL